MLQQVIAALIPALVIVAIFGAILRVDHLRCMEKRRAMMLDSIKRAVPVENYWIPCWTFYVPNRFLPREFRYTESK